MDEHSRRATRTPHLAIPLFEHRRSGDAYSQAEPNFLTKEQRIHVSVVRINRLDFPRVERIQLLGFFDFRSFYSFSRSRPRSISV